MIKVIIYKEKTTRPQTVNHNHLIQMIKPIVNKFESSNGMKQSVFFLILNF